MFEGSKWIIIPKNEYSKIPKLEANIWISFHLINMVIIIIWVHVEIEQVLLPLLRCGVLDVFHCLEIIKLTLINKIILILIILYNIEKQK